METKSIAFDDYLNILWGISQAGAAPGNHEDFMECLKVSSSDGIKSNESQAFDKDGNGFVSTADIRRMMCNLGEKMSEAEVEFLLNDLVGYDGMVKYADFIKKLCSSEENWQQE